MVTKAQSLGRPLDYREHPIAVLVAQGLSNKEVAERLHVSYATVTKRLSRIYAKTGVRNRTELAIRYRQQERV